MPQIKKNKTHINNDQVTQEGKPPQDKRETPAPKPEHLLLIEKGEAGKLSPKSSGKIYFELVRQHTDNLNYLRITGNDGGGLHSREWISIEKVINALKTQEGHPFKSSILKTCMVGKSANNVSFLAAILRSTDIKLIKQSPTNTFSHLLVDDFDKQSAALLKRDK
jgi:hypothetical protein